MTLIVRKEGGYSGVPLLTTMNLYEHEVLFIFPALLYAEIKANSTVHASVQKAAQARMLEIVKWIGRGHTLIVIGLSAAPYYWTEQGASLKTAIEQLPPFNNVKLTAKSGDKIRSSPTAASLLDNISIPYDFVLEGPNLIPLLFAQTTHKTGGRPDVVAGALKIGEGFVIFAPEGRLDAYWKALERLPSILHAPKVEFPDWVDSFRTSWEKTAFANVAVRKAELERLQAELSELDDKIGEARRVKQLFVGTGMSFEDAVATALAELGLEVAKGPHPRADLLVTDGQRVAAIEAKGIEGAAKEEYVRQVRMWMPEVDAALATETEPTGNDLVLEDYRRQLATLNLSGRDRDQDCKGILVLGTFRLIPLAQRKQPDFPENVKGVLVRQDICALTGIQLFCLLMQARSDEARKEQVRHALFNTRGVLEMGHDWAQALEQVDQG